MNTEKLRHYLQGYYQAEEWPCLLQQAQEWASTRPLEGLRILDATPLFRNTLGKFLPLMAAGAEIYVPWRSLLPTAPEIDAILPEFGIRRARRQDNFFDIILDCAGQCNRLTPSLGACELTRSGVERYERATFPVFNVDGGRIKRIETILGTGESFLRAMAQLGHQPGVGQRLLVIGYGKVGRGIVHYAAKAGLRITVADMVDKSAELPAGISFIHVDDREALQAEILRSWCTVTATGHAGALRRKINPAAIMDSPTLLANLGVEDEYGSSIPEERILNHKKPLNFILEEPTLMRFIETTLALHNACALELLTADLPHSCLLPPVDVEERLLVTAADAGLIGEDMGMVL